jgi:hypothetical protein
MKLTQCHGCGNLFVGLASEKVLVLSLLDSLLFIIGGQCLGLAPILISLLLNDSILLLLLRGLLWGFFRRLSLVQVEIHI